MKYRPYFHRFSIENQKRILTEAQGKHITWGEFMKKYRQPEWCDYPDALGGVMGCWSLIEPRIHDVTDCYNCDLIKEKYRGPNWRDPRIEINKKKKRRRD